MASQDVHSVADDAGTDPEAHRYPFVQSGMTGGGSLSRRIDPQVRQAPNSGNLYDVLDLVLDKGIVIDAFVRVSVVGIELLTIDARVVIASVDTYLRYARAAERLNIYERDNSSNLKEITQGAKSKAMEKGAEKVGHALTGGGDDDGDEDGGEEEGVGGRLAHGVRHVLKHGVGRIMERLSGEEHDEDDDDDDGQPKRRAERDDEGERPGQRDRDRARSSPRREREGRNGGAGRSKAGSRR